MDRIVDTEARPDQASLSQFEGDAGEVAKNPPVALQKLELTAEKFDKVAAMRNQRSAVRGLMKDGLAQKLISFHILYVAVFLVLLFLRALVSRSVPGFKNPDAFTVFFAANFIYLGFLMLLSLAYGIYRELGWPVAAVIIAILAGILPTLFEKAVLFERVVSMTIPTFAILSSVAIIAVGLVIKRTTLWSRLMRRLAEVRRVNLKDNQDRMAFRTEVEGFLLGGRGSGRTARVNVFGRLRRAIGYCPVDVLYFVLTRPGFPDKKGALGEYAKQHRFKDAMGRLAAAVWVAGALAYIIFPESLWGGEAALAAVNVLPVYAALMFVMDRLDDADEDVFRELDLLIRTEEESSTQTST